MNLKDEPYLMEMIKDQVCYVAESAEDEIKRAFPKAKSHVSMEFVLPDGVHNERGFVQDPRDPACVALICQVRYEDAGLSAQETSSKGALA